MNIVTKSGTNDLPRQLLRAVPRQVDERDHDHREEQRPDKQDYRRNQFGGSFGGPIIKDKLHYFGAVERTQQDTFQVVNTRGLFPSARRHLRHAVPRDPVQREGDRQRSPPNQYLSVRYGRNQNSQPYGAARSTARRARWGKSKNEFNSINVNHNWVLGGSMLNEFIFQYADFTNDITANSHDPVPALPERRRRRPEPEHAADHRAEEVAVPRRLLVARHRHGRHRSRLQGRRQLHQRAAPVHHLQLGQGRRPAHLPHRRRQRADLDRHRSTTATPSANIPLKQYAGYIQDDWAVTDG